MEAIKPRKQKMEQDYSMLAIHKELHKEVKAFCAANGYTMISFVESLLKAYMKQHSKEG